MREIRSRPKAYPGDSRKWERTAVFHGKFPEQERLILGDRKYQYTIEISISYACGNAQLLKGTVRRRHRLGRGDGGIAPLVQYMSLAPAAPVMESYLSIVKDRLVPNPAGSAPTADFWMYGEL